MTADQPCARRSAFVLLTILLTALLTAVLSVASASASSSTVPEPQQRDYRKITKTLEEQGVPGWAVAVVSKDRVLHQEASGSDSGEPVSAATPFLVGSVSKTFTATLVMQLADKGTVNLDKPVTTYLPDFRLAGGRGRDITVRQLLTHTSGLSAAAGVSRGDVIDDRSDALQRLTRSLQDVEPISSPGASYEYSSANYLVLGALVERVTGVPFGSALRTHVLQPLGMSHTITTAQEARASGLSAGHRYVFGRAVGLDRPYVASGVPYGYVGSSLTDMQAYARFQLGAREGVLRDASRQAMQHGQVPTGDADRYYGYGWSVGARPHLPGTVVEHTGSTPGTFAHLLLLPSQGLAVIVLANAGSEAKAPALAGVGQDLLRTAVGEPPQPQSPDPLLSAAPWIGLALGVGGLVVLALQAVRLSRRHRVRVVSRVLLAIGCVALIAAMALVPGLLGLRWGSLRLWAPDLAWALATAIVIWALAGVLALVRLRDRAPRSPSGSVSRRRRRSPA